MVEIETVLTVQAEPVQEPVAWQWLDSGNFRKAIPAKAMPSDWRPLYAAPLNLNDPAVQKRLAAQWGYVKAGDDA